MSAEISMRVGASDLLKALSGCSPIEAKKAFQKLSPQRKQRIREIYMAFKSSSDNEEGTAQEASDKKRPDISRFKSGPYWDTVELLAISRTEGVTESEKTLARVFLTEVTEHGDHSLAHLALQSIFWNKCKRTGIETIEQLRDILLRGDEIPNIKTVGRKELVQKLVAFDEALAKA